MTDTHYGATRTGQPACHGYKRAVPAGEPLTMDPGQVTCPDCLELQEAPAHTDDTMYTCPRCRTSMLHWQRADHDRDCPVTYADRAYRTSADRRKADRDEDRARNRRR